MASSPDTERAARRLVGALMRAHQSFTVQALSAAHPDLDPILLGRAIAFEQQRDAAWQQAMTDRASAKAVWATDPALDPQEQTARMAKAAGAERRHLAAHLREAGHRVRTEADLARLRLRGEREGYWQLGRTEAHCRGCAHMAGKVWSLDVLARYGPQRRHPGCDCRVLAVGDARARGVRIVRGRRPIDDDRPVREAQLTPPALQHTADDELLEAAIGRLAGQLGGRPDAAARLAAQLREAVLPHWREQDRWPAGSPLGGRWRPEVDVPAPLKAGLAELERAARRGDLDGVMGAHGLMVRAAQKLPEGSTRDQALRAAHAARQAILNPRGLTVAPGAELPSGPAQRAPVPLASFDARRAPTSPWSATGSYLWRLGPTDLGDRQATMLADLARRKQLDVSVADDGSATISVKRGMLSGGDTRYARTLELLLPQLRSLRAIDDTQDLADARPLGVHPDETPVVERGHESVYPNITTDQLGAAGESLIDAVGTRIAELGLVDAGSEAHLLAGQSELDWQIADLGVEVKSIGLPRVVPGRKLPSPSISAAARARKIAEADQRGLRAALVTQIVDLDGDRAYVFLHEYPEGERYTAVRPPVDLLNRLMDGSLRPGDQATARNAAGAGVAGRGDRRHVFLGAFRLGFNPLTDPGAGVPDPDRTRPRARPADTGVSGPLGDLPDQVATGSAVDRAERRAERAQTAAAQEADLRRLAAAGVKQADIAEQLGISQGQVSKLMKRLGITKAPRQAGPGVSTTPARGPSKAALSREARGHHQAGLSIDQIAKKMNLDPDRVRELLADTAPTGRERIFGRGAPR